MNVHGYNMVQQWMSGCGNCALLWTRRRRRCQTNWSFWFWKRWSASCLRDDDPTSGSHWACPRRGCQDVTHFIIFHIFHTQDCNLQEPHGTPRFALDSHSLRLCFVFFRRGVHSEMNKCCWSAGSPGRDAPRRRIYLPYPSFILPPTLKCFM